MIDTYDVIGDPLPRDSDFIVAAIDILGRTGATETQIRCHDDMRPTVWIAVACWKGKGGKGGSHEVWRTGAALNPDDALYTLMELVLDGGYCTHCGGVVQVERDHTAKGVLEMSCVYAYDPELKVFRRSCEEER